MAPAATLRRSRLVTAVEPVTPDVRERILSEARAQLFAYGYSSLTMDSLAGELGISKKTLYVYFRGKELLIRAVLEKFALEVRSEAERWLTDRSLTFAEKLRGFALELMRRLALVSPAILRDLQRFAPALHRHVEELRGRNIPYIFGRFVEAGQIAGMVRDDVTSAFAGEFYLHAMQGMMQPATLQRLDLRPEVVVDGALRIFFGGLLTPAGQKQYEKSFPRV